VKSAPVRTLRPYILMVAIPIRRTNGSVAHDVRADREFPKKKKKKKKKKKELSERLLGANGPRRLCSASNDCAFRMVGTISFVGMTN